MSDNTQTETFSTPLNVMDGYRAEIPFSPKIELKFTGIRISAPEIVENITDSSTGAFVRLCRIPISMTFQFSLGYFRKFDFITDHMVVVAVNTMTGKSYSNTLGGKIEFAKDDSEFKATPEELANTFFAEYLTFDLARVLRIPQENAIYNVHVTLEEYQSNVVTIEVKKKEK